MRLNCHCVLLFLKKTPVFTGFCSYLLRVSFVSPSGALRVLPPVLRTRHEEDPNKTRTMPFTTSFHTDNKAALTRIAIAVKAGRNLCGQQAPGKAGSCQRMPEKAIEDKPGPKPLPECRWLPILKTLILSLFFCSYNTARLPLAILVSACRQQCSKQNFQTLKTKSNG